MYKKLIRSKPHYLTQQILQENNFYHYLENNMSHSKGNFNPNLQFETPTNVKRKLDAHITAQTRSLSAHPRMRSCKSEKKIPQSAFTRESGSTNFNSIPEKQNIL